MSINNIQVLTFELAGQLYGVDISYTREVVLVSDITKVPKMPEFLLGVINLRGYVVPVVDFRKKFLLEAKEETPESRIIIFEINHGDDNLLVGALVDAASKVLRLDKEDLSPAPQIGTKLDTDFIEGIANLEIGFVFILNAKKIFSVEEINLLGLAESMTEEEVQEDESEEE